MSPHPAFAETGEPLQPPSTGAIQQPATAARFLVGRDAHGGWIVQDRRGRIGGLFASQAAALHFAREECHDNPTDICQVPEGVVLDFGMNGPDSVH